MKHLVVLVFSVGLITLGAGGVSGQEYPSKPVRFITGGLGSSTDFIARIIAQGLTSSLGQQVVVENRPSGVVAGEAVAKAPPDGYILLVTGTSFWVGPLLRETPYDPVRDFAPVSLTATEPSVLVVHRSLPVNSIKELIALAKARPGELNYASGTAGGADHLAAALFTYMAGVKIVHVPYSSPAVRTADLLAGQTQMSIEGATSVAPHVKSGKVRALAVTSLQPSALVPGLPPVAATVPGYEAISNFCLFAPAKTPAVIITRLNREVAGVLNQADVKQKLLNAGQEVVGSSPEQLATMIKSEMARLGKLIKDVGIKVN